MNKIYKYLDSEEITYIGDFDEEEHTYYAAFEWGGDIVGDALLQGIGQDTIELATFQISKEWKKLLEGDSIQILGLTLGQILLLLALLDIQQYDQPGEIVLSADVSFSLYPEKLIQYYKNLGFEEEDEGIWSGSELMYQNMRAQFTRVLQILLQKLK